MKEKILEMLNAAGQIGADCSDSIERTQISSEEAKRIYDERIEALIVQYQDLFKEI